MEQRVAPAPGRTKPRWSRLFTGAAAQTVSSPALIAGLPGRSAIVCVGPPLSARPAGSSNGSVLLNEPFAALNPQLEPSSRLCPPSVMVPTQDGAFAAARMLLRSTNCPPRLLTPPP